LAYQYNLISFVQGNDAHRRTNFNDAIDARAAVGTDDGIFANPDPGILISDARRQRLPGTIGHH
jgi:hypothetical protein